MANDEFCGCFVAFSSKASEIFMLGRSSDSLPFTNAFPVFPNPFDGGEQEPVAIVLFKTFSSFKVPPFGAFLVRIEAYSSGNCTGFTPVSLLIPCRQTTDIGTKALQK
jgi:hypothetical protein